MNSSGFKISAHSYEYFSVKNYYYYYTPLVKIRGLVNYYHRAKSFCQFHHLPALRYIDLV